MDFFETGLELIPKVHAQNSDTNAQPTFGTLEVGDQGSSQASVNLTSSNINVDVGDEFEVEIEIKTGTFTINEYTLVIDFDPAKVSVLDADDSTSGTQIEFLDTVFEVADGDNIVSQGEIKLTASTPSGNALQVNRSVARIRLQAQSAGDIILEPVEGVDGTQLINQNGIAIDKSVASVTITASSEIQPPPISSSSSSSSSGGAVTDESNDIVEIPATALSDDIAAALPVFIGLLLIAIGISLSRERKKPNNAD